MSALHLSASTVAKLVSKGWHLYGLDAFTCWCGDEVRFRKIFTADGSYRLDKDYVCSGCGFVYNKRLMSIRFDALWEDEVAEAENLGLDLRNFLYQGTSAE